MEGMEENKGQLTITCKSSCRFGHDDMIIISLSQVKKHPVTLDGCHGDETALYYAIYCRYCNIRHPFCKCLINFKR